ncbi:MAG: SufD family Fe-S cluster assembly protein [Leptospira sp.]|nr:SufD family Fe-S cluster assembly protein [Leptospira sp.]
MILPEKFQFVLNSGETSQIRSWSVSRLNEIGFPLSSQEEWRKFPLQKMDLGKLGFEKQGGVFAPKFVEDKTTERTNLDQESSTHKIQEFSFGKSFDHFFNELKESVKDHYFSLLSLCYATEYEVIAIGHGESLDWNELESTKDPKFLVRIFYLRKNSKAECYHNWKSESKDSLHFLSTFQFTYLEENVKFQLTQSQSIDGDAYFFFHQVVRVGDGSDIKYHLFPNSGFRTKQFHTLRLVGKESKSEFTGVSAFAKRELFDLDVKAIHLESYTESKISYKAIVTDNSHHLFTGNLYIPPKLKKVSAHQESFNLSLNQKARAEANPNLEVYAEDVSCTHGATVGDINEDQYFYLLSRGLTPDESKALLVEAFYAETIEAIFCSTEIKENLKNQIRSKMIGVQ